MTAILVESGRTARQRLRRIVLASVLLAPVGLAACQGAPAHEAPAPAPSQVPVAAGSTAPGGTPSGSASTAGHAPDHVVVVIFENKGYTQLTDPVKAPWIHSMLADSAVFTNAHALTHPSQPNYIALFSGSTQAVTDDHCPVDLGNLPNLGQQLIASGRTFVGYAESMPHAGYLGCSSGLYAAKHVPWADFKNVPASSSQPYTAFPSDYSALPTVSFLIPNMCNDMHNCPVTTGDTWSRNNLTGYVAWAKQHNSLLILTFDENDGAAGNRILTLFAGGGIKPGEYSQNINHYTVLRTIESWYGLTPLLRAADATPITGIWSTPTGSAGG